MDSDSDLFESADEELDSDDNEDDSKRPRKNIGKAKDINVTDLEIENLTIKSKFDDSLSTKEHSRKTLETTNMQTNNNELVNTDKHEEIVACENNKCNLGNEDNKTQLNTKIFDENNANTISNETSSTGRPKPRVIERKERPQRFREPKTKLGVKLGTKISSTKVEVNWDTLEEVKKPVNDVSAETKKSEYGVPPRLVSCWEDTMSPQTIQPAVDKSPKLYSEKSDFNPIKNFWDNEADYMELPKEEKKENILPVLDKLVDETNKEQSSGGGWGGWSNWGVSSLLSTATLGVSTLTSSVSQGISTVLESGIGVPDPEELARIHKAQKEKVAEQSDKQQEIIMDKSLSSQENSQIGFGLGNLVSGVTHITKLVEATGTNILTGGLDTLEVIGKKTMEVLQEGDPGLKKKRALLGINEKPVLSQILREAKEKAEEENKFLEEKHIARRPHYETIFDDYQGLVHLEALEMLSKQCDIKLGTLLETYKGSALTDMQETMAQIKELCELPDEDDDSEANDIGTVREKIDSAINDLNIQITYEHFLETWTDIDAWLQDRDTKPNESEVHEKAIESLAQLTAIAVEQFHKAGELLLVKERRSTVDEADSLVQLTVTVTGVIGVVAGKFSEQLNSSANGAFSSEFVNSLITNIFLEAANSSSYIQDAFNLMMPVLQVGAVQKQIII